LIVDYHLHLRDSEERIAHTADAVEPFAETAAARGVDEIGFTEHVYYFRQTRRLWKRPDQTEACVYDLDAYVGAVLEAKRRGLPVKLGLEVDYVGDRQHELAAILKPYPWDYLLGSVHWIDGSPSTAGQSAGSGTNGLSTRSGGATSRRSPNWRARATWMCSLIPTW